MIIILPKWIRSEKSSMRNRRKNFYPNTFTHTFNSETLRMLEPSQRPPVVLSGWDPLGPTVLV